MYGECDNSTHFLNFELKQGSFLEVNRWEVNILEKNFLIFEVNYDISPFIIFLLQYRELFSQSKVFKWRLKPWRLTWFSANQVWIWVKIGDFLEVKLQNVHRTYAMDHGTVYHGWKTEVKMCLRVVKRRLKSKMYQIWRLTCP